MVDLLEILVHCIGFLLGWQHVHNMHHVLACVMLNFSMLNF